MKLHLADDKQTVTFLLRRDEFHIALELLAILRSPNPKSAQKLVDLYNELVRLIMEDAENAMGAGKPKLTLIPGGKEDDDTVH